MVIQNYHCILYYQNLVILQKKKKSNSGEFLPRQLPGTKIVKWEQMGVTQKERECMHLESSRTPEPVSWEAPPGDSRIPRLVSYITNRGNRALEMQCPQFQRGDQSCWHQTEPNCQYVAKPSQPLGQSCTQHWPLHIWVGAQSQSSCTFLSMTHGSREVRWLWLWDSTAGGAGSIPGWGTKIPHAAQCGQ